MSFLFFIFFVNKLFQGILCKFQILLNEECKSKITIEDTDKLLLETLKGKINIKKEHIKLNNFDIDVIQKLNKNIKCPYIVIDDTYNKIMGMYLGAGINLFNYNHSELDEYFRKNNFTNTKKYIELFKDIEDLKNINESLLNKYKVPFEDINKFNLLMVNFSISKFLNKTNNYNQYNPFFLNGMISVYIQHLLTDDELQSYLNYYNPNDASYFVEHLFEIFPNTRLIQSKFINFFDTNFKYNFNHIFIVVEKNIFQQNELNNINQLIKSLYDKLNNNNRISILISNENKYTYIINYKKDKDNIDELLKNENKSDIFINITNIYTNINQKFEENKEKYFENKIVILLLNYESKISQNKNELIEKYKKEYSIQTIPIINTANSDINNKDIFEYNIFYNFTENIYIQNILLAISNMHICLDLSDNKEEIQINNINLNDIDNPLHFEVNINPDKITSSEYYEISLNILDSSGYNIFISGSNPYPNVRNNLNNFMKYENNKNPIIRIKSAEIKKNSFYIGIEGNLRFNITITKKIFEGDIKNLILSNGEYDYIKYNISLDNNNNNFTFGENYNIKSRIFLNETKENVMKYFTRGIDLDNTEDNSFLNYNLFTFIFGKYLLNRVYKNKDNIYYFGYNLNLKEFTPLKLKNEGFNKFTINKLYPFLNASSDLNNSFAPSVYFDENELKKIFNIIYTSYIKELSNKIRLYPQCIHFEEQSPTVKFILFSLYFSYSLYQDNSLIRAIIFLSLKNPDYNNAISSLEKIYKDNKFLLNYIKQIEQEDKQEKIMTAIIMGKSLLLSDVGLNFINEYYNIMSKSMTKISISVYDTSKNDIKNIIPFSSTNNNQKVEEIIKSYQGQIDNNNYNTSQEMNLEIINNFAFNQFKNYDKGIKKKLLVVCDENLKENNYLINNKLMVPEEIKEIKNINTTQNIFSLILLTTKNYEKGEIHDLFLKKKYNYTIYENYFHISNLKKTNIYMQDLNRLIKGSVIKIKLGQRLINDYYQNKNSYFQIDCSNYKDDVIVIKTNISNFNFYASATNPFPYYSDNNLMETKKDAVVITKCMNGFAHFCLEPKSDIKKEIIEIFSCESYQPDNNCKSVANNKKEWIFFAVVTFGFLVFFSFYKCKYNLSRKFNRRNKKRLNVFDSNK